MTTELLTVIVAGLQIGAQVLLLACLADLLCGLVHWFEDNYGDEDWPIVGQAIIAPNRLHHDKPRAFLANSWWQSANVSILAGSVVLGAAYLANLFSWQLVLFVLFAVNGNEVHKWAHRSRVENGRFITWLQEHGIVQGRRHHANHHRGLRNTHYCPMTPWVNPVADKLGFWRFLEFCVYAPTGIRPRDERAAAGNRG